MTEGHQKPDLTDRIEVVHARLKQRGVDICDTGTKIVLQGQARFLDDSTQATITRHRAAFRALVEMDQIVAEMARVRS